MTSPNEAVVPPAAPKIVPYGPSITLAQAKTAAAAALATAVEHHWAMVVAIVDPGGHLVYLEKLDETQVGSVAVAQSKARSAVLFKRATKVFQDRLAGGGDGLLVLRLQDAIPIEGGIPLIVGGHLIGAVGVSGGTSPEDGVCARAGVAALG